MPTVPALSAITALPDVDPEFRAAAHDLALIGGGLVTATDSSLLAIAIPSRGWQPGCPVQFWNQRLEPCALRASLTCELNLLSLALEATCRAADMLGERLSRWGWIHAETPGLCALMDGSGLLLAPERPPMTDGPRWLLDVAHIRANLVEVIPSVEDSLWALVRSEAGSEA